MRSSFMMVRAGLRRCRVDHVALAMALLLASGQFSKAQMGPVPVAVATAIQREVASGQTFVATVMPKRTSMVGSAVADRVVEFPVNEGDYVKQGQLLAKLRTKTLEIDLAAAQAELDFRKEELAELEHGSRPEEIAQAKAKMLAAKATMTYFDTRLKRYRKLFEKERAAEDEMSDAIAGFDRASENYKEAQAGYNLAVEGPRKERIAQARARVRAQEEEIRRIQDEIDRHSILAPFDGYVVAEHTEVGQWLANGGPVVDLAELDEVDVQAMVLEDYIQHVRIGTEARVELGAMPGRAFAGRVVLIVPQAEVRSRSFPVKVRLKNKQESGTVLVKAGMFARVTLPVGEKTNATLVPKDAIVLGGQTPIVYVVDLSADGKTGTVRPVSVILGVAWEGLIEVKGLIKAGQVVVTQGNERLRPGQEVLITTRQQPVTSAGGSATAPSATR